MSEKDEGCSGVTLTAIVRCLADDFACVRRLMDKPEAAMSAPEVMDCVRLSMANLNDRIERIFAMLAEREKRSE